MRAAEYRYATVYVNGYVCISRSYGVNVHLFLYTCFIPMTGTSYCRHPVPSEPLCLLLLAGTLTSHLVLVVSYSLEDVYFRHSHPFQPTQTNHIHSPPQHSSPHDKSNNTYHQ